MAHIYIYSPSGAVRDRAALRRGIKRLQALGHEVEIDSDALAHWQRFAGDDATRLAAIGRAAASGADVALISRGGYGLSRLLPDLPYKALERAISNGMQFVGFSDFTALQMALLVKSKHNRPNVTWAGPALLESFGGEDEPDEITRSCFQDVVLREAEGIGWRLSASDLATLPEGGGCLAKDAVLWGGNLAILVSLLGTPWWPQVDGGVLFLEDVGEHPYRIERMLIQLLHAGVLARQKAIVLGQFNGYVLGANEHGYSFKSVVQWLREQVQVPILTGLPFGHVPTKVLLPVVAKVHLLVEDKKALMLWGHLH